MSVIVTQDAGRIEPGRIEGFLAGGDLARLTEEERIEVYHRTCAALGLNPATRPLEYLRLQGRLTLYVRKEATDQLRRLHGVSIRIVEMVQDGDLWMVRAEAQLGTRTDEEVGIVVTKGLSGEALAIARMKAMTKAKRRVTLSIVGLGFHDVDDRDDGEGVVETPMITAVEAPAAQVVEQRPVVDEMETAMRQWRAVLAEKGDRVATLRLNLNRMHRAGTLTADDILDAVRDAEDL